MKKILFLLLVTSISYSQALFDKGIKVTGGITTDNTATKVVVQSANNVLNTIAKNDLIDVIIVNTTAELTSGIGNIAKLYATRDNTIIYRYNGTVYVALGGDISAKEDVANKQNSLATDVTNLKYPTVTAVRTHTTDTNNPHAVTKAQVGLANVDNTSDVNKAISTATQTALNLKANLASPTLTGTPIAPTATSGTNTTQIATTAFVTNADSGNVKLTGNQTITGIKTFNTSFFNKIDFVNASSFDALSITNSSNGKGLFVSNSGTQSGIYVDNTSLGFAVVANGTTASSGLLFIGQNNGVQTFNVNKLGATTATSFIKSSAPSTNLLLAGGGDIAQSSLSYLPLSGGTVTGALNGTIASFSSNLNARQLTIEGFNPISKAITYNNYSGGSVGTDYINASGNVTISLNGNNGVSTFSSLSGPGKRIVTANASGQLSAEPIPVFADNTAAIAGGLGVGALYRTVVGLLAVVF